MTFLVDSFTVTRQHDKAINGPFNLYLNPDPDKIVCMYLLIVFITFISLYLIAYFIWRKMQHDILTERFLHENLRLKHHLNEENLFTSWWIPHIFHQRSICWIQKKILNNLLELVTIFRIHEPIFTLQKIIL